MKNEVSEPYEIKCLPKNYLLSAPYEEIDAWRNFAKFRYERPEDLPIFRVYGVFNLLTFQQYITEFKEHLEKAKNRKLSEYEWYLELAKKYCRKEGAPYVPYVSPFSYGVMSSMTFKQWSNKFKEELDELKEADPSEYKYMLNLTADRYCKKEETIIT